MASFTLSNSLTETVQLGRDDMYIIHDLAHRIWPHTYGHIISQSQLDYMLDWMYDVHTLEKKVETGILYYIVKSEGVTCGFIGMEPNFPDAGFLRIHNLYVLPEMQGKGLGRVLLNQAIDVAFDLDLHTLHLNVNRFNKAQEFYEHVGFKKIGEEDIDIGQGYLMEDYIMVLPLVPAHT